MQVLTLCLDNKIVASNLSAAIGREFILNKIDKALVVRGLVINPPLFLAPMAGLTHLALRRIIKEYGGVGMLSTEMLSARRLPGENPSLSPFLVRTELEAPLSYQIFVSTPADIAPALEALARCGADAVDINMGCPAPKLRMQRAGAALMAEQDVARAVVAEARRRTELPLSVKIRLGEELNAAKLRDFCLMLEGEGIDLLTVHARLRGESFQRKPHWEWIGMVKQWLSIPVVANGGIFTVEDASRCLAVSGADGLMIGRGAAERPWIFAQFARELYGLTLPRPEIDLPALYHRFWQLLEEHFPAERRLGRLKQFTHYFQANYAFGHSLASMIQSADSMDEARSRAECFLASNRPRGLGFNG